MKNNRLASITGYDDINESPISMKLSDITSGASNLNKSVKQREPSAKKYPELSEEEIKWLNLLVMQKKMVKSMTETDDEIDNEPEPSTTSAPPKEPSCDDDKVKKLEKQLKGVNSELDKKKSKIGELNEKIEKLTKENADLKKISKEKRNEPQGYSKAFVDDQTRTIDRQRKEIDKLKNDKARAENDKNNAIKDCDAANRRVTELENESSALNKEIEDLKKTLDCYKPSESGTVRRVSATELHSTMFEDGFYEVRLASDYSYIDIKKSDSGKANCWEQTIRLPKLGTYVAFQSECDYKTECSNNVIRVLIHGD